MIFSVLPSFEGEHLERIRTSQLAPISRKGKTLGSHMVRWIYPVHQGTLATIGWIIGGRVHRKSSAWKVTHMKTILALGNLTS